jgi:hypothetical protein
MAKKISSKDIFLWGEFFSPILSELRNKSKGAESQHWPFRR